MLQSAHILSKYMTDQVKEDVDRDELVSNGVMTQEEADEESDEWSQVSVLIVMDCTETLDGRTNECPRKCSHRCDGLLRFIPIRCLKRDFQIS
jgi:hypothetical protein